MFIQPVQFIVLWVLLALSGQALAIAPEDLLRPEQAYRLSAEADPSGNLRLTWDIEQGYYLYRSKFKFLSKTPGVTLGAARFPSGENKVDEFFGEMEIYRGRMVIEMPLSRDDPTRRNAVLEVISQGCADAGVCFPPYKQKVAAALPALEVEPPPAELPQANPLGRLNQSLKGVVEEKLLPPDEAFRFSAAVKDGNALRVSWLIAPGYYLYRDKFSFDLGKNAGAQLAPPALPAGQIKQEEEGPREIFRDEIAFDLPLNRGSASAITVDLRAKFQGCAEQGVCYPPMEKTLSLDLPPSESVSGFPTPSIPASPPLAEHDRIAATLKDGSLWGVVLSFFGFGLLMAFSPCVFPMIPILSGIIVGHGHKITTSRAFMLSLSYVLAAALAYTVFGVLAGLFGQNLQAHLQNPWVLASFSGLFVALSLSMFGFYELQMPSFIQSKVTELSHKQKGGTLTGAAVMGVLSALIVGPCMAAPLAGALIYIGHTGDALLGGLALFSLGLGMGMPLLLIGLSAGKLLPRAGVWMNSVKSAFGVIMLAIAVWLLDRILPANLTLFLWALLLIIPAIYLNALDSLPPGASGWRKLWKGVGVAMLAYGVLMLIGVAIGNGEPLRPMRGIVPAGACAETPASFSFRNVATVAELQAAIKQAGAEGRWTLLDFYADWCVTCKEMESETFADPRVRAALEKLLVLRADVTANSREDEALLQTYGLFGPPATLFFSPEGGESTAHRLVGFVGPDEFLGHLRQAMR